MCDSREENVKGYYFHLIDIAKLVCAFLVVLIHCVEVESGHPIATFIVKCFSTQAVPFFMIASGFFVANQIDRKTKLNKDIGLCFRNWLFNYCVWSILCLYPIQAGCLFLMACQPIRGEISKSLCLTCRNMSSAIYFLHTVFIYGIIDPVFGVDSPIIMKFSVSVLLSIVALCVVKRMKKHPVKWLLCVK